MTHLQLAIDQIVFARDYTIELLDHTPSADWFRQPPGGVTHIAWQIGHLTYAQYRLTLERIRGPMPQDAGLVPDDYAALFGLESQPSPDASRYPTHEELRVVFDRVHEHVLRELRAMAHVDLHEPIPKPHPFIKTKLAALLWCAHHEMLHAGQIGLLRRLLGHAPF